MKNMPTIGLTLFLALFFAVGFGVLGYGLLSLFLSNRARTWSTTEGTVESCRLVESSDSDGSTYRVHVDYAYTVDGRQLRGDRIAYGYSGSSGRSAHQEIADRLSSARTVLVRYDPANPARAVLSYGLNRSTRFVLVFGATWLLFVTGFTALWLIHAQRDSGLLETLITTK